MLIINMSNWIREDISLKKSRFI